MEPNFDDSGSLFGSLLETILVTFWDPFLCRFMDTLKASKSGPKGRRGPVSTEDIYFVSTEHGTAASCRPVTVMPSVPESSGLPSACGAYEEAPAKVYLGGGVRGWGKQSPFHPGRRGDGESASSFFRCCWVSDN